MNFSALVVICVCFAGGTYAHLQLRTEQDGMGRICKGVHCASTGDAHEENLEKEQIHKIDTPEENLEKDQIHKIAIRTANPLVCNGNENLCSLRFNQVTFPGTHNAGSGFCGPLRSLSGALNIPCFTRNQDLSFTEQLQLGIRFFDIDLCYLEQVSDGFSPAGPWTCHNDEYGGAIEKVLTQIDQWMQLNPYEVIGINFNSDFDHSLSDVIAPELHALLQGLWDPTPERISDGNLTMNTVLNETLLWPTLSSAILTNQRIFIFMFESLWLGGRPWIHVRPTGTVGPVVNDDCSLLVENSRRDCNLCVDLVQLDFYGNFGHCIFDMARICSLEMYNGSQACYDERIQFGKTVNSLIVDFPNRFTSPFTVNEVAEAMNVLNIQFYNSGPVTTQQPPPSSCLPEPIPRPEPSPLPPVTSSCEALQRIALTQVGYFQCEANVDDGCDRLVCPSDLMDTNGAFLFQLEIAILSCDSPPAIQITLADPTGDLLVSATTSQSDMIDFLGIPIDVTLDQLENEIGLQLITTSGSGSLITLIEYIIIPIDTATCPGIDNGPGNGAGRMVPPACATGLAVILLLYILMLFP